MGKNEALWMLTNWKNLKRITGEFNDDPSIDRKLKSVFEIFDTKRSFKEVKTPLNKCPGVDLFSPFSASGALRVREMHDKNQKNSGLRNTLSFLPH
jgi:hypothetical protein